MCEWYWGGENPQGCSKAVLPQHCVNTACLMRIKLFSLTTLYASHRWSSTNTENPSLGLHSSFLPLQLNIQASWCFVLLPSITGNLIPLQTRRLREVLIPRDCSATETFNEDFPFLHQSPSSTFAHYPATLALDCTEILRCLIPWSFFQLCRSLPVFIFSTSNLNSGLW